MSISSLLVIETLSWKKEEVESVRWFDLEETYQNCQNRNLQFIALSRDSKLYGDTCTVEIHNAYPTSGHFLLQWSVSPIMSR